MHVYDKIFVSMPMCMIEIEDGEDDGENQNVCLHFMNQIFRICFSTTIFIYLQIKQLCGCRGVTIWLIILKVIILQ